ncbi:MAG: hypothetical protein J6M59_01500 [Bacteroidaceae bacterium]|nr:hypothetical protein [Bacteroidaceae bacterium]
MNKRYLLTLLCILLCGVIVCAKVQKKENHNISIDPKYPIELLGQTIKYNGKYIEINDRHLLVCPNLEDSVYYSRKYVYRSVKEAFQEIPDELTTEGDIFLYLTPGVHWVDQRLPNDNKNVKMQMHNGVPTSVTFACHDLHIVGLNPNPENVVIAGNRGNMRGAVGDYAMFFLRTEGLYIENVTIGNYCNVSLKFPLNHSLDFEKITSQSTQAQLCIGLVNHMYAINCRFIGSEKATPPMGRRTLFNKCFFEVGDMPLPLDAVFLNCDITWHSNDIFRTMYHSVFLNSKIYTESASIWQFHENPNAFLTMVDCEVHDDDFDRTNMTDKVKTMAGKSRCYFSNVKYNGELLSLPEMEDGFVKGGDLSKNNEILSGYYSIVQDRKIYNTYDLLCGTDGWDPMGVKTFFTKANSKEVKPFRFAGAIEVRGNGNFAERRIFETDKIKNNSTMVLRAKYVHISSTAASKIDQSAEWIIDPKCASVAKIVSAAADSCVVSVSNNTYYNKPCNVLVRLKNGLESLCTFTVSGEELEAPSFVSDPVIIQNGNVLSLKYKLRNAGDKDNSLVKWMRCKDRKSQGICVMTNNDDNTLNTYKLTSADNGYYIKAQVAPRCKNSKTGKAVVVSTKKPVTIPASNSGKITFSSDFKNMSTANQPKALPGFWLQDIYVPRDSANFVWFNRAGADAWTYGSGRGSAAPYKGFCQQVRGARLVYIPDTVNTYSADVDVTFKITPSKGQGQGVAMSGEYIDLFIQYDPVTSTGYGVRLQRWPEYNRAITYTIMKYRNGFATPISRSALSNCFVGGSFITISISGRDIAVKSYSDYPVEMRNRTEDVNSEVLLTARVNPLPFRAIGVHSMASQSSPILLREINCEWKGKQ